MTLQAVLKPPFPPRNAATALRRQVLEYLMTARPAEGTRLATDEEIVKLSHLSRSTVRRAMDQLVQEGWVRRRAGAGTFVGDRIRHKLSSLTSPVNSTMSNSTSGVRTVRLAVLVFRIGDMAHDWYTPLVLEGLDHAAEEFHVSVEIVGNRDHDIDAIARRIERSRPDVLACLTNDPRTSLVIRDAQRMGVKCLVTGTPHLGLGVPVVHEDNHQAIQLAVEHLAQHGHRKIGLILQRLSEPWVFHRHEAFLASLARLGLPDDESLVHWLPMVTPQDDEAFVPRVHQFVRERGLSAVVAGNDLAMHAMDTLARRGAFKVPEELSVVNFEQDFASRRYLGLSQPTTVIFPLKEMGRRIAEFAKRLVDGLPVEPVTVLRAELMEGQSVARHN